MRSLLTILLVHVLITSFTTFSQGYVSIESKTNDSQIVVNYKDTFELTNNKIRLRIGKEVTIIENTKSGYLSKTKSVLFSRVKSVICDFEPLTKVPVLSELDKHISLNDINYDSLLNNVNTVIFNNYSDFNYGRIDAQFKSALVEFDLNRGFVHYDLKKFMTQEDIAPSSETNALSVTKNSVRLNIDIKSLTFLKIREVMTVFKLEYEYELLDLRFNEIIRETFTIESKHSTGQDFSENFAHTLKEGLCQFVAISQSKGMLQLDTEEPTLFTGLIAVEPPTNSHSNFVDARNAVVTIITENGHGSGCLISGDGYVLTNYHVISKSDTIKIVTFQGDTLIGEVSMTDPSLDISLVKINKQCPDYFELKENKLPLGETVYAIGTPIDLKLSQSISKGIISAHLVLNKIDYIQTDAEINGGNSGGALVNSSGELIGLVNAKAVGMFIEGIGFAIDLKSIIERINITYK